MRIWTPSYLGGWIRRITWFLKHEGRLDTTLASDKDKKANKSIGEASTPPPSPPPTRGQAHARLLRLLKHPHLLPIWFSFLKIKRLLEASQVFFFSFKKKCTVNNLRGETTYIRSFIIKDKIIDPLGDFWIWHRSTCIAILKGSKPAKWIFPLIWNQCLPN